MIVYVLLVFLASFEETNFLSSLVDVGSIFTENLPYFVGIWYEMYGSDLIFLLLHNEVPIPEHAGKQSVHLHIDLHNFWEVHDLQIFLENEGTIDNDELVPNYYNKAIIVPYDPEHELNKTIIYQQKYDGKKYIIDDLKGILTEISFINE